MIAAKISFSLDCITKNVPQASLPNGLFKPLQKGHCSLRNSVGSLLSELSTGDTFCHLIMFLNLLNHFCGLIKISLDTL